MGPIADDETRFFNSGDQDVAVRKRKPAAGGLAAKAEVLTVLAAACP
jgi:hypothetical protein